MKRVAVYLTLTAVLALVCAVAAQALPGGGLSTVPGPSVSAVQPATAANDIDVPVTITGADFATGESGAVAPTVTLGGTALTNVTFVDSATLTATVPWGMDPGSYALTVTNPDGGSASLPAAFTVTQGLGRWNGAALYGGDVRQILMKPGDPNTLYAPAYGLVGLFRSTDAAATWQYVGGDLKLGNNDLAVDPQAPSLAVGVHRRRRGALDRRGRHLDDPHGAHVAGRTPDRPRPGLPLPFRLPGRLRQLLLRTARERRRRRRAGTHPVERRRSTWTIVADLVDASVVDLAFDPADASRMALVTQDARVFRFERRGPDLDPGRQPGDRQHRDHPGDRLQPVRLR